MILVLDPTSSKEECQEVLAEMEKLGLRGELLGGLEKPLVHVVEGAGRRARRLLALRAVQGLVPTSGPRIRLRGRHFFPFHFINWTSAALPVIGLLVALAGFFPPGLGQEVDPTAPPPDIEVPWFAVLPARFAATGWKGAAAAGALLAFLLLVPWLDRSRGRALAARTVVVAVGAALVAGCLLLTL